VAFAVVSGSDRDLHAAIHGSPKSTTAVVVGMIADDFDSARSIRTGSRPFCESSLEKLLNHQSFGS
jgi:hypothetical protein